MINDAENDIDAVVMLKVVKVFCCDKVQADMVFT